VAATVAAASVSTTVVGVAAEIRTYGIIVGSGCPEASAFVW
jgi:hypothetical protein